MFVKLNFISLFPLFAKMDRRTCPICLEECLNDSIQLPCLHQLHKNCLDIQLKTLVKNNNKTNSIKCSECLRMYTFSEDRLTIIETISTKPNKYYLKLCDILQYIVIVFPRAVAILTLGLFAVSLVELPIYAIVWMVMNKRLPKGSNSSIESTVSIGFALLIVYVSFPIIIGISYGCKMFREYREKYGQVEKVLVVTQLPNIT